MVNMITFIDENKYFMTEFDNFNYFNLFYFNIIKPFLLQVERDGVKGYVLEHPFKMNKGSKKVVIDYLKSYTRQNNKFNKILSFFNNIDDDKCFYIFKDEFPQESCETCKESLRHYNVKYDHDFVHSQMQGYLEVDVLSQKIVDEILEEYELMYHRYTKKIFLGEKDKKKRICRFCGKSIGSGATFISEAHAIPALIGNKTLFQNEECDECNAYFGASIENDLDNYTKIFRIFAGIEGRNGIPELKCDGKEIFYSTLEDTFKGPVIISDYKSKDQEGKVEIESDSEYIQANVYRMFCKIFISVVDSEIVTIFNDTIKWIRFNKNILERLPLIAICFLPNKKLEKPEVVTYIKKSKVGNVPFAFMEFRFGNLVYIIQIPSEGNKDELFYETNEFNCFLKKFKQFKNASFLYKDFSSKHKKKFKMNIETNSNLS